jgi:hypothetical protein
MEDWKLHINRTRYGSFCVYFSGMFKKTSESKKKERGKMKLYDVSHEIASLRRAHKKSRGNNNL